MIAKLIVSIPGIEDKVKITSNRVPVAGEQLLIKFRNSEAKVFTVLLVCGVYYQQESGSILQSNEYLIHCEEG